MIHVQKVAQQGICSCLSIAVSVTLLLEITRCTACPSAHGLRPEWCRGCGIPVLAASVWSRHSWIFDTASIPKGYAVM